MNNETQRKLTSLTLMTIMVAGGVTFGIPGITPEAHAENANLRVSAENAMFENYFGGPQIIEVVIDDDDIDEVGEGSEPTVEINGDELRMVHASDGKWYGYFAANNTAQAAHDAKLYPEPTYLRSNPQGFITDADGYIEDAGAVLREAESELRSTDHGNLDWPFIQLYQFNEDVTVTYEKGGGDQTVELTFDTVEDFAGLELDRSDNRYPQSAQIHATITDTWLNIDPTDEDTWTFDTESGATYYRVFDDRGNRIDNNDTPAINIVKYYDDLMCDDNCVLLIEPENQYGETIIGFQDNDDSALLDGISQQVSITEQGSNSGIFGTYDEGDISVLFTTDDAQRGTTAIIDYNDTPISLLIQNHFATIDIMPENDMWSSGQEIAVVLEDSDINKNGRDDEDITLSDPTHIIPSLATGDPFTLGEGSDSLVVQVYNGIKKDSTMLEGANGTAKVEPFSQRAIVEVTSDTGLLVIDLETTAEELFGTISDNTDFLANPTDNDNLGFKGYNMFNYDVSSLGNIEAVKLVWSTDGIGQDGKLNIDNYTLLAEGDAGLVTLEGDTATQLFGIPEDAYIGIAYKGNNFHDGAIVSDFFSFGFTDDGEQASERTANQIMRLLLEESDDNSGVFEGGLEYVMINQLNVLDQDTYEGIDPLTDVPIFIVFEDLTDEDAPRVNYLDLGADGVETQIADQEEAASHSGTVTLGSDSFKVADTVTITLTDPDLNVDSELIEIYTTVAETDTVGKAGLPTFKSIELGKLLDVTFDDATWTAGTCNYDGDKGLYDTGFTLIESDVATGVFTGDFQIPAKYCADGKLESTTGVDIEVNYVDFRDASGEIIEVGDSAGVRANTGTVSLDRPVYPVPWGEAPASGANSTDGIFPLHDGAIDGDINRNETLGSGDLTIHVRINDPDYDVSAAGEDSIDTSDGDVLKITVSRGSDEKVLGTDFGSITEIAPDAGIFELDFTISSTDGPQSPQCPRNGECILQGDILTVEYNDPTDASGDSNTVTDSATFDLRNGVLQTDKSVYIIGSDIILTVIEPDWDLDNDAAETYSLDIIEWDSDAATLTLGELGGEAAAFDPEPSALRETGDSTGIFQVVLEMPAELAGDRLERGEEIELEYTDWGPAGSDYVGQEHEDVSHTIFTSNFGATVELDQKVYSWTDKVYITIVAPDHNYDSDLVDEIGNTGTDPLKVSTRSADLDQYKLVETGTNTGIFTGEVTLTGFAHDADGDGTNDAPAFTGKSSSDRTTDNLGPTNGFLETDDDDGITVSFEFSEDETIVGSALIRWNIGEVQWLESSYPASGQAVLRVVDADMNLNPESVDNFAVDVWSDSDSGGIDLTVTETNESTGIFEGTVQFTLDDSSSGHRLRISEGDQITAEYEDNTLPDPYTRADELDITATSLIGTVVAPLERVPAANLRIVDTFDNAIDSVSAGSQVQITADLMNGQDMDQAFAYIVQVEDANGVAVELAWITGSLTGEQSLSPSLSWTPQEMGTYTASIFVWESLDSPTALSPSLNLDITVN